MELMSPLPTVASGEPVQGWRIWNLADAGAAEGSAPSLRPAGSGVDAWAPRRAAEARCAVPPLLSFGRAPHQAPAPGCRCGIYASRSFQTFDRPRPAWPPPPVVGSVALWGTVIEHEHGWRGRFAYPSRLALVCPMCAWYEPGPGVPEVVHAFADMVYPLCEQHRGGITLPDGRRTRAIEVSPRELQARLLDEYAVEVLPFASFEWLCRQPRTPEPPAFFPSIKPISG
jgi:hypothetical protein